MTRRRHTLFAANLLALFATLALLVSGCGKDDESPGGRPVEMFPAAGEPAVVKLLDTGSGDKVKLRWHAKQGTTARLQMNVKTTIDIEMPDQKPTTIEMPMELIIGFTYREVTDDKIVTDFKYERASMRMPFAPASMMRALSDELAKIKGSFAIDSRGSIQSFDFDMPKGGMLGAAGADQMMTQMKDQMAKLSMPFPEEAIGVGAKWEALQTVELMGMKMRTATVMKLVAVKGDVGTFEMVVEQVADKGPMKLPGMGASGPKMSIDKAVTKAKGRMKFDLGKPFVMAGDLTGTTDVKADITVGGQTRKMTMAMDLQMAAKPLPSAPASPTKPSVVAP